MRQDRRSTCPISTGLELLGDRWTLAGHPRPDVRGQAPLPRVPAVRRGDLEQRAGGPAQLAGRERHRDEGGDPTHAQKAVYSLTEKGLELLPVLVADERVDPEALSQDAPARSRATRGGGIQVREATRGTPSARTRHLVMSVATGRRPDRCVPAGNTAADGPAGDEVAAAGQGRLPSRIVISARKFSRSASAPVAMGQEGSRRPSR